MSVEMNQHQLVIIDGKYDIVPVAIAKYAIPVAVPVAIPQPSARYRRDAVCSHHHHHHHHKR